MKKKKAITQTAEQKPETTEIAPEKEKQKPAKKPLKEKLFFKIFRVVRTIIYSLFIAVLAMIIIATIVAKSNGQPPSLFGYSIFRVSSRSMVPTYEIGDVILVKETDPSEIKKGDIVTYNGKKDEFAGKIITHRVVRAPYKEGNETFINTRGDASENTDPAVNVKDVLGVSKTKIPALRDLYSFFLTPLGLIIIILLVILAFFNEIVNFIKSVLGIGYEEEPNNVEEIIERYQKEQNEKKSTAASGQTPSPQDEDKSDEES